MVESDDVHGRPEHVDSVDVQPAAPVDLRDGAELGQHVVDDLYHYVVVRLDVPRGTQAAQIVHAAGESACLAGSVPPGTNAVALGVPSEARLIELGRTLTAAGIPHAAITETEGAFAGQVMALGCCPAPKAKLKKFFSSIPLIKEVARRTDE